MEFAAPRGARQPRQWPAQPSSDPPRTPWDPHRPLQGPTGSYKVAGLQLSFACFMGGRGPFRSEQILCFMWADLANKPENAMAVGIGTPQSL